MSPTLSDMPCEIVLNIAQDLNTTDLCNLRLTNKRTEAATFKAFAHEFFSKKQFMFTEPSLQTLIDISNHPQFGPELKHLIIGLDYYRRSRSNDTDSDQTAKYHHDSLSQFNLIESGVARDMLVAALSNLPYLETVDIRDFASKTRKRDGAQVQWNSYGSTTVKNLTGIPLVSRPCQGVGVVGGSMPLPRIVFSTVIQALGLASRSGVSVETVIREQSWGLSDSSFALPAFTLGRTLPILKNMKRLHLCLHPANSNPNPFSIRPTGVPPRKITTHLQNFLSHTSNLEWLRLNFFGDCDGSLLEWLRLPESSPVLTPVRFSAPLRRLDLGFATLSSSDYTETFLKFQGTLEAFSIRNSMIQVSTLEGNANVWGRLFKTLALKLPHLKEYNIAKLRMRRHERGMAVTIDASLPFIARGQDAKYRGSDAGNELASLGGQINFNWPAVADDDADMDDVDDDDDEDDEDDEVSDFEDGEDGSAGSDDDEE